MTRLKVGEVVTVQLLVSRVIEDMDGFVYELRPVNSTRYTLETIKVPGEMIKEVASAGA